MTAPPVSQAKDRLLIEINDKRKIKQDIEAASALKNGVESIYGLLAAITALLDRVGKWLKNTFPHKIILTMRKLYRQKTLLSPVLSSTGYSNCNRACSHARIGQ